MCYQCQDGEAVLLSKLIACQSEYLTPLNIIQIIKDIVRSVASLQKNFISHGCIDTNAIFICLPTEVIKYRNC